MIRSFQDHDSTAALVDFYELTMIQAAMEGGKADMKATFDLFARKLPNGRRYGVVGGTNRALEAVLNYRFTNEQINYLRAHPALKDETIDFLRDYSFKGIIRGYNEGDLYFPNSPILTVEGTFAESVLLETVLLSIYNHDSAVMSAASRMVVAAKGTPIIEMGSRRTHERSAVAAARAAYIAGFASTSNVEAGIRYGIPTTGTSAHAFSLAFADEREAFEAQVKALGVETTLLVDTYDIEQGIRNAVAVAGTDLGGIRIDSGDLHEETVNARKLLDSLGAKNTRIVLSSDIDEYSIAEMMDRKTPVDGVGAGTRVVTGSGAPTAGMVFKLVEREDENGNMVPVAKRATGKKSSGGRKVAYRRYNDEGKMTGEFFRVSQDDQIPSDSVATQSYLTDGKGGILTYSDEANRNFHSYALSTLPDDALSTAAGDTAFTAIEEA